MAARLPALQFDHNFCRLALDALAISAGKTRVARWLRASAKRTEENGGLDSPGKKVAGPDADRDCSLADGYVPPRLACCCWSGRRTICRVTARGSSGDGRSQAAQLPAGLLCRHSRQYGPGAGVDEGPRRPDERHVHLDESAAHQRVYHHIRALLDRLYLPLLPGQRSFNAGDIYSTFDELRYHAWVRPACPGDDLDFCFGGQDLCLPVGGDDRWLLLWLFRRPGPASLWSGTDHY